MEKITLTAQEREQINAAVDELFDGKDEETPASHEPEEPKAVNVTADAPKKRGRKPKAKPEPEEPEAVTEPPELVEPAPELETELATELETELETERETMTLDALLGLLQAAKACFHGCVLKSNIHTAKAEINWSPDGRITDMALNLK